MSQRRVIVNGTSTWVDLEPTGGTVYGFMEPAFAATIHRRRATPEELAIVAARDNAEGYLRAEQPKYTPPTGQFTNADREQESRMRGVARSHPVKRPPKPPRPSWRGPHHAPGQRARVIARATVVMEAMERHGDDKAAVGRELGMRLNTVSMVVKHARMREVA